jgi:hypothetical protein
MIVALTPKRVGALEHELARRRLLRRYSSHEACVKTASGRSRTRAVAEHNRRNGNNGGRRDKNQTAPT